MHVPVLVRPEEVPVGPPQKGPQDDQRDPQHEEAELEGEVTEPPFGDGVIAVSFGVVIEVGNRHQAHDDQAGQHHPGHPGVEVDQHLLQAQEVPRGLGRIGGLHAAGRFFQGGLQADSPEQQQGGQSDHADQFRIDQVGPDQDLFVVFFFQRGAPLGDPLVVFHRSGRGHPGEETQQKHQAHDRHIVRLGRDPVEILVGHGQPQGQQREVQAGPGHHGFDEETAGDVQHRQEDQRADAVDDRPGRASQGRIDAVADPLGHAGHPLCLPAKGHRREIADQHPGHDQPEHGRPGAVLVVPQVIGRHGIHRRQGQVVKAQKGADTFQE